MQSFLALLFSPLLQLILLQGLSFSSFLIFLFFLFNLEVHFVSITRIIVKESGSSVMTISATFIFYADIVMHKSICCHAYFLKIWYKDFFVYRIPLLIAT